MINILCLFLMIYSTFGKPYNEYTLTNKDFSAEFNKNGILLDDKYNIKYNNIKLDKFNSFKDYSISTITANNNNNNNININIVYEMSDNTTYLMNEIKKIVKYEDDKLYVSIYIDDKYKDFDLEFSIDNYNTKNNYSIDINNEFIIKFNELCLVDGESDTIYLSKLNNKYRIHFPSFNYNLHYQFIISSNKPNKNHFNMFILAILIVFSFIMYKKQY